MDEASSGWLRGRKWDDNSSDDGDASTGRAATVFSVFGETFWNRIAGQLVAEEGEKGSGFKRPERCEPYVMFSCYI